MFKSKNKFNKRRSRFFIRKLIIYIISFFGIFLFCLGLLFLFTRQQKLLLNPVKFAVTQIQNAVNYINTDVAVNQTKSLLDKHNIAYKSVTVNKQNDIVVELDSSGEAILSPGKDLPTQIASLQVTIAHLTIIGKRFVRLDFRFERPVVLF